MVAAHRPASRYQIDHRSASTPTQTDRTDRTSFGEADWHYLAAIPTSGKVAPASPGRLRCATSAIADRDLLLPKTGEVVVAKTFRFVAAPGDSLDRFDKFLVASLERAGAPTSRAIVQRWIQAGRALVDGRTGTASQRVAAGAVVDLAPLPPEPTSLLPDPSVIFDVLYEDPHLIVLDKPGGLVVHPARGHATGTLVHGLLARGSFALSAVANGPDAHARPGIVHRLDQGTSGILVVARDEPTRESLKAQFARHDIERAYLAIVVGRANDGTFETLHGRHRTNRLKFTTRVATGKRALTRVRVLERLPGDRATLVECRIETGRTHQIRLHLSECAMTPVLGDPLYGRSVSDPLLSSIAERLGRQALHAAVLGFSHPATGERLHFRREPPTDFMAALRSLREAVPKSRA